MIKLENDQFRFTTSVKQFAGQQWTIELLNPTELQQRWLEIHYGTRQTPDIIKFIDGFSGRWPCGKVFLCEDYLVDFASLFAYGDFNVGQVRQKVGRQSPGRFNSQGTEMSLINSVGQTQIAEILAIIVSELQQLAEAA